MKNFKKVLALLLVMVMTLSLAACGKDKSSKGDKDSDSKKNPSDIYEALESLSSYTEGTMDLSFVIDGDIEGEKMTMSVGSKGSVNGSDGTVGFNATLKGDIDGSSANINLNLTDAFIVKGDKMFLDIDAVVKSLSGVKTEFGTFAFPMPDYDKDAQKALNADSVKLMTSLFKAVLKDAEVKQDGSKFTVEFADAESMKKAVVNAITFVKDNQKDIVSLAEKSSKTVDANKYAEKLINFYKDDIVELGVASEDEVDELIDQIKESVEEVEEVDFNEMFKDADFDGAIKEVNDADMEDFSKANPKFTLSVETTKKGYEVSVAFTAKDDDNNVKVEFKYVFEAGSVKVAEPSTVASIKEIGENITKDPQVLQDILTGLQDTVEKWGLGSFVEDDDDDYYSDDYDDYYDYDEE